MMQNMKGSETSNVLHNFFSNYGYITQISSGIAQAKGLYNVRSGELVKIYPENVTAIALNLEEKSVGLVLCDRECLVNEKDIVVLTGKLMSVFISDDILGSVIDPLGKRLSSKKIGNSNVFFNLLLEQKAPDIISRQPIYEPLLTGLTIIDCLVPIGRGQRELIIGDRQTGKTSIAIDTILNQSDVVCVYVSIGQKCSAVAKIFNVFKKAKKMNNIVIVLATASDPAPLQYLAPYTGCTIAEFFRDRYGLGTLVIYDDLSKHAAAYRQMSLLLRRPPGREAFPGDVFYLHSRLLERAAKLSERLGGVH